MHDCLFTGYGGSFDYVEKIYTSSLKDFYFGFTLGSYSVVICFDWYWFKIIEWLKTFPLSLPESEISSQNQSFNQQKADSVVFLLLYSPTSGKLLEFQVITTTVNALTIKRSVHFLTSLTWTGRRLSVGVFSWGSNIWICVQLWSYVWYLVLAAVP